MFYWQAAALRDADDLDSFVSACRDIIEGSPHIAYHVDRLDDLRPLVASARPATWDWYLRDPSGSLDGRWYDMAFSSALNGGYFEEDKATGEVRQWAVNGSGSEALMRWLVSVREASLLPGVDHVTVHGMDHGYRCAVDALLEGVPYAPERRAIFEEFAAPGAIQAANRVLDCLSTDVTGKVSGFLGLREANHLALCFPNSFGADPFRKKACLAVLLLTSHLNAHGHAVTAEIPIPSDYQIPRIFAHLGILSLSSRFSDALSEGRLLDVTSEPVMHFRAAAVVAAHDLGRLADVPDWLVDGALFNGVRKDPEFKANALPPMKIHGVWF